MLYTDIEPGLVTLEKDILTGWNWPGTDKLAVWESLAPPRRYFAADRATASDGTTYPSAEDAATSIGAKLSSAC